WREDLGDQTAKLLPLGVLAAAPNRVGEVLQPAQCRDLGLELLDGSGCGGLVEDLFLHRLDLVFGGIFEILEVVGVKQPPTVHKRQYCPAALQLHISELALQPLPPPPE